MARSTFCLALLLICLVGCSSTQKTSSAKIPFHIGIKQSVDVKGPPGSADTFAIDGLDLSEQVVRELRARGLFEQVHAFPNFLSAKYAGCDLWLEGSVECSGEYESTIQLEDTWWEALAGLAGVSLFFAGADDRDYVAPDIQVASDAADQAEPERAKLLKSTWVLWEMPQELPDVPAEFANNPETIEPDLLGASEVTSFFPAVEEVELSFYDRTGGLRGVFPSFLSYLGLLFVPVAGLWGSDGEAEALATCLGESCAVALGDGLSEWEQPLVRQRTFYPAPGFTVTRDEPDSVLVEGEIVLQPWSTNRLKEAAVFERHRRGNTIDLVATDQLISLENASIKSETEGGVKTYTLSQRVPVSAQAFSVQLVVRDADPVNPTVHTFTKAVSGIPAIEARPATFNEQDGGGPTKTATEGQDGQVVPATGG